MSKTPISTPPFVARRPLPPAFPSTMTIYALPAGIRAQLEAYCEQTGEEPGAVLCDAVTLLIDELAGEVMDERELGYKDEPWPSPPGAPDPVHGPSSPAPQAPPAHSGGAP